MPKRPRTHKLEEISRNQLHNVFTQMGWVVWDLHPDYGEDLLVRIFINDVATRYSFFVQAKATDHIDRYIRKDGKSLSFPIDADHIEYWKQFLEPVILTVWDAKSGVTYWELIQNYLERYQIKGGRKKYNSIDVPTDNTLDEEGIKRIIAQTKSRFARLEQEHAGAEVLRDLLGHALNAKIEYSPHHGILTIEHPTPKEAEYVPIDIIIFGKLAALIKKFKLTEKLNLEEYVLQGLFEYVKEYDEVGHANIRDSNGNIVEPYETPEERFHHIMRKFELLEFEDSQ